MAASLVALPLPQARALLDAASEALVRVSVTGAPGAGRSEGVPRVVRERRTPLGLELTVAVPTSGPPRDGRP